MRDDFSDVTKKNDSAPKSLKLAFSKAADYARINQLFDPTVKNTIDPSHYITKRKEQVFRDSMANGCIAFLEDDAGVVAMLASAYRVHLADKPASGAAHDYTELATAMARLKGYHNADLVIAALILKEWWTAPPKRMIIGSIDRDNAAAKQISAVLGVERITDPAQMDDLVYAVYKTAVDETGQNRDVPLPTDEERERVWFLAVTDKALAKQANVLLGFMNDGGVRNKKTGHFLPVDFSALDAIGLTRARLEAIAKGNMSRGPLKPAAPKP